jgi:hypothetical protein
MIKYCYIWTRVSTKHQEENGGSLDDQNVAVNVMPVIMDMRLKVISVARTRVLRLPVSWLKRWCQPLKRIKQLNM